MWLIEFDGYFMWVNDGFFCKEYFTILGANSATYHEKE